MPSAWNSPTCSRTTGWTSPSSSSCRVRCPTRMLRCPRRSRSSTRSWASRFSPAPRSSRSPIPDRRSPSRSARTGRRANSSPTRCCRPSVSRPTSRASVWRTPEWPLPIAVRSPSTSECAPMCPTFTRSATSRPSCSWLTSPRRRPLWRPKPSLVQRHWSSATTG
ncbi:Uncharacterised protein [Mycobacteroides abscessus subsp. massiliense]|nr:Uncharacterised protein [Mycobacteroides abscessus subsp. massiliense]